MAQKYSPDVDDAISAALARGEQPSTIYDQLTEGTLDGLTRPVDMPRRTFRYRVQRIRERIVQEAQRESKRQAKLFSLAQELTMLEMPDEGYAPEAVAAKLNLDPDRVVAYVTVQGASSQEEAVFRLRDLQMPPGEIARFVKLDETRVRKVLAGPRPQPKRPKQTNSPQHATYKPPGNVPPEVRQRAKELLEAARGDLATGKPGDKTGVAR